MGGGWTRGRGRRKEVGRKMEEWQRERERERVRERERERERERDGQTETDREKTKVTGRWTRGITFKNSIYQP